MTHRYDALTAAMDARQADFAQYRADIAECVDALLTSFVSFLGLERPVVDLGDGKEAPIVGLSPGAKAPGTPLPEGAPTEGLVLVAPNRARAVLQFLLPSNVPEMPVYAMGVPIVIERTASGFVLTVGRAADDRVEIGDLSQITEVDEVLYDLLMQDIARRPTDARTTRFGFIPD